MGAALRLRPIDRGNVKAPKHFFDSDRNLIFSAGLIIALRIHINKRLQGLIGKMKMSKSDNYDKNYCEEYSQ